MQTSVTGHHVLNPSAAHPIPVWPQTNDAWILMSLPIAAPGLGDPTQGIADYLRWKEVLFKRVYEFNDKAEAYHVWKATFLRTMSEINVNAADQVDLLTKWLGKISNETARRIRQAIPNNHERAMTLIWERLDECYGAPELIKSSIKSRIADFQLTGSKDAHRLYELLDLLTEVASLMEDIRCTHLLSYYNTSSGLRPIISKLPLNLRNKWTTRAARYQNQYQVAFPHFLELLQFIRETAKIMINPCFNYETPSASVGNARQIVGSTKQTDTRDERPERGVHGSDSDIFCPYHNSSNHTLNDCCVFRRKSEDKRREFLQYHTICFRCCEIPPHNSENVQRKSNVLFARVPLIVRCYTQMNNGRRDFVRLQFLTARSWRIHPSKLFRSVQVCAATLSSRESLVPRLSWCTSTLKTT